MSKGFRRSKSSVASDLPPEPPAPAKEKPKRTSQDLERTQSQVLVEDTPVKPIKQFSGDQPLVPLTTTLTRVNRSSSGISSQKSSLTPELDEGRSFVTDTPIKLGRAQKTGLQLRPDLEGDEDEDDDEWVIGSPSVRRSLASALTEHDVRGGSP